MAFFDRIPRSENLERHKPKLGGFVAGVVFALLFGLLGGVIYTGKPAFSEYSPDASPIYPNL
ncbi:MAG: hypothetical protein AAGB18_07490 [Pseudomonadota bacterium]